MDVTRISAVRRADGVIAELNAGSFHSWSAASFAEAESLIEQATKATE
jgi:hypothetical protein